MTAPKPVPASLLLLVVAGVTLVADAAQACPSCVDPRDTTRTAMLAGTIALSLLPLGFIGGVAAWLWHAHKADDRANDSARD